MRKYGPWVEGDTATSFVYTPKESDGDAYPGLATAQAAVLIGKSPTTKQSISITGAIAAPIVTFSNPFGSAALPSGVNRNDFVCRVKITNSGGAVSWQSQEMILQLVRFPV